MKKLCESLREHAQEIINFKKKKVKLSISEQQKSCKNAKICYIHYEKFEDKYAKDKTYHEVRDHCQYTGEYRGATSSIYNLKYSIPKEISVIFHNGFNNYYRFIITELAEEFEGLT